MIRLDLLAAAAANIATSAGCADGKDTRPCPAWAARAFLLLGADGLIREDYQLTVKPLAG